MTYKNNKSKPLIIIGGYPNSGTSFLCNLVSELGFSPGELNDLKKKDTHNRFGYFEYVPLRNFIHEKMNIKNFQGHLYDFAKGLLPKNNLLIIKKEIQKKINEKKIEVFKDNAIPLTFEAYPENTKFIVISRNPLNIYESPKKAGFKGYPYKFSDFKDIIEIYNSLTKRMSKKVSVLEIKYEYFNEYYEREIQKICDFLKIKIPDNIDDLKRIYKPRYKSNKIFNLLKRLKNIIMLK